MILVQSTAQVQRTRAATDAVKVYPMKLLNVTLKIFLWNFNFISLLAQLSDFDYFVLLSFVRPVQKRHLLTRLVQVLFHNQMVLQIRICPVFSETPPRSETPLLSETPMLSGNSLGLELSTVESVTFFFDIRRLNFVPSMALMILGRRLVMASTGRSFDFSL
jgi:hypothetical protein